ncbi:MAG: NADPH:quinone oxidoreductase family protein [Alphaproteobacteria bacterium]
MKAIQCAAFGAPETLSLVDLPNPTAGPAQVVVDVKACGANFVDALLVQGLYQVKPPLPYFPGNEVSGVVLEVGEGVEHLKAGDEVMGLTMVGGFAEQLVAPAMVFSKKPEGLSFPQAAAFLMNYCTVSYALDDIANIQKGETVLILGAGGGVGLAALDLAIGRGARVIAAAASSEKRALCLEMGASDAIDYDNEDLKARVKELGGADIIVDPVGGKYTEQAFRAIKPKGRHLIIGFAAGDIPRIPVNLALLKRAAILGVDWGGYTRANPADNLPILARISEDVAAGRISPVVNALYPLEETGKALRDLLDRKVTGKAVVVTS